MAIKLIQVLVRKRSSCTSDLECFEKRTSANRRTCLKASLVDTLSREAESHCRSSLNTLGENRPNILTCIHEFIDRFNQELVCLNQTQTKI